MTRIKVQTVDFTNPQVHINCHKSWKHLHIYVGLKNAHATTKITGNPSTNQNKIQPTMIQIMCTE